jgi:hypothetical protein
MPRTAPKVTAPACAKPTWSAPPMGQMKCRLRPAMAPAAEGSLSSSSEDFPGRSRMCDADELVRHRAHIWETVKNT